MKRILMTVRCLALCIFLPAMVACTQEEMEDTGSSTLNANQFLASFSEDGTKVTMDADYHPSCTDSACRFLPCQLCCGQV